MSSVTYTYQAHVAFAEQLKETVQAVLSTLEYVVVEDTAQVGNVSLTFSSVLSGSEQTWLSNLMATWVNPAAPIHTEVTKRITVSLDGIGTDFNSLSAALDFAQSATQYQHFDIVLHAGTYILNQTYTLDYSLTLSSLGGRGAVTVSITTSQMFVKTSSASVVIRGLVLLGNNDITVTSQQGELRLMDTELKNASKALEVNGGAVYVSSCIFDTTVETAVDIVGAADVSLRECDFTGNGTTIHVQHNDAELTVVDSKFDGCDIGLNSLAGRTTMRSCTLKSCVRGVVTEGSMNMILNDINFIDTVQWSLDIQTATPNLITRGLVLDRNQIRNPFDAVLFGDLTSISDDKRKHTFLGTVSVGDDIAPTRLFVGQGDANTIDMSMMGNSQLTFGAWTNMDPTQVHTITGATDEALYIGHKTTLFGGVQLDMVTPAQNQSGVWEYYDGQVWKALRWMVLDGVLPYRNRAQTLWTLPVARYYVAFEKVTDWVPVTLNGMTMYFVRYRFDESALSRSFQVQNVLPVLNTTVIEENGTVLRFGDARRVNLFPFVSRTSWALHNFENGGNVFYATTTVLPSNLDTSCQAQLTWKIKTKLPVTELSTLVWQVRYCCIADSTVIVDNVTDTWFTTSEDQVVEVLSTVDNDQGQRLLQVTCDMDLTGALPGADTLCIQLMRVSTDVRDTLSDDVHLVNAYMQYVSYIDGTPLTE